jgi:hypothetical protein
MPDVWCLGGVRASRRQASASKLVHLWSEKGRMLKGAAGCIDISMAWISRTPMPLYAHIARYEHTKAYIIYVIFSIC